MSNDTITKKRTTKPTSVRVPVEVWEELKPGYVIPMFQNKIVFNGRATGNVITSAGGKHYVVSIW